MALAKVDCVCTATRRPVRPFFFCSIYSVMYSGFCRMAGNFGWRLPAPLGSTSDA